MTFPDTFYEQFNTFALRHHLHKQKPHQRPLQLNSSMIGTLPTASFANKDGRAHLYVPDANQRLKHHLI